MAAADAAAAAAVEVQAAAQDKVAAAAAAVEAAAAAAEAQLKALRWKAAKDLALDDVALHEDDDVAGAAAKEAAHAEAAGALEAAKTALAATSEAAKLEVTAALEQAEKAAKDAAAAVTAAASTADEKRVAEAAAAELAAAAEEAAAARRLASEATAAAQAEATEAAAAALATAKAKAREAGNEAIYAEQAMRRASTRQSARTSLAGGRGRRSCRRSSVDGDQLGALKGPPLDDDAEAVLAAAVAQVRRSMRTHSQSGGGPVSNPVPEEAVASPDAPREAMPPPRARFRTHQAVTVTFELGHLRGQGAVLGEMGVDVLKYQRSGKACFGVPSIGFDLIRGSGVDGTVIANIAKHGLAFSTTAEGGEERLQNGDVLRAINGATCATLEQAVGLLRAAGDVLVLTCLRKQTALLLQSTMEMRTVDGAWCECTFSLRSNRTLTWERFDRSQRAAAGEGTAGLEGELPLDAMKFVKVVSARDADPTATFQGGYLQLVSASGEASVLRDTNVRALYSWQRELHELLPQLQAAELFRGWLWKQGEARHAAYRKRFCVLFSSSRMLYFTDASCAVCQGAVDLATATNIEAVHTGKGPGFEVATLGRTWRFAPPTEVRDLVDSTSRCPSMASSTAFHGLPSPSVAFYGLP